MSVKGAKVLFIGSDPDIIMFADESEVFTEIKEVSTDPVVSESTFLKALAVVQDPAIRLDSQDD